MTTNEPSPLPEGRADGRCGCGHEWKWHSPEFCCHDQDCKCPAYRPAVAVPEAGERMSEAASRVVIENHAGPVGVPEEKPCKIGGPDLTVGDVDWHCWTHDVDCELRRPVANPYTVSRADVYCPIGEPAAPVGVQPEPAEEPEFYGWMHPFPGRSCPYCGSEGHGAGVCPTPDWSVSFPSQEGDGSGSEAEEWELVWNTTRGQYALVHPEPGDRAEEWLSLTQAAWERAGCGHTEDRLASVAAILRLRADAEVAAAVAAVRADTVVLFDDWQRMDTDAPGMSDDLRAEHRGYNICLDEIRSMLHRGVS